MLTRPKIQPKIPHHSGYCLLGDGQLYALPLMANSFKGYSAHNEHGSRHEVSYLIHYDCLLKMWQILVQNATEVYYRSLLLMRQVFYYKMRRFCYRMQYVYYDIATF